MQEQVYTHRMAKAVFLKPVETSWTIVSASLPRPEGRDYAKTFKTPGWMSKEPSNCLIKPQTPHS